MAMNPVEDLHPSDPARQQCNAEKAAAFEWLRGISLSGDMTKPPALYAAVMMLEIHRLNQQHQEQA